MDPIQKQITKAAALKMQKFAPKQIAEQKLKAFSIGAMGKKGLSRIEEEKKKKKDDEEAIKNVYAEFNDHFEDKPGTKINKTWVKAGTFDAGSRKETVEGKGTLYKPTSKLAELAQSFSSKQKAEDEVAKKIELSSRPEKPGKKKITEKKKSNLEIFKEELKAIQEERDERNKYKAMIKAGGAPIPGKSMLDIPPGGAIGDMLADVGGDPTSTNLYLGNLSPRLSEPALTEMFGRFGPLASVKIMYPRTEDEKNRGKHCGFVAYMSRIDGERSLAALAGKNFDGFEMRMGWGKPVPIPLHPIYVPPSLLKFTMPPQPSGLPFNCQPDKKDSDRWGLAANNTVVPSDKSESKKFDRMMARSQVKVVIPTDRSQLCLINRMVEFVIREGAIFEATIMNRELQNPQFKFLFENQSPEHIYYRWRLFSMLQGDSKDKWLTTQFKLFKGGPTWRPPLPNIYTNGMPLELLDSDGGGRDTIEEEKTAAKKDVKAPKPAAPVAPGKKPLTDKQRDFFEDILRSLLPDRNAIAESMVWCIEHAESGEEIVDCLTESLSILETPVVKKIARLFLISDILHNCTVKGVPNVSYFRNGFQVRLNDVFSDLHSTYKNIPSRMKAESFKQRVMSCFRAWEDWALYPMDALIKLQNIFLGLVVTSIPEPEPEPKEKEPIKEASVEQEDSDEDVDGVPLDGAALLKASAGLSVTRPDSRSDEDSLDGAPIDKHSIEKSKPSGSRAGFVSSKWETVDPEEVKAQAVTTSKWEVEEKDQLVKARKALMGSVASKWDDKDEDIDGEPLDEDSDSGEIPDVDTTVTAERRALLRDVEVKVMQYQDELETGNKGIKSGWTISDQVEHYRKKMLRKATEKQMERDSPRERDKSPGEASDTPERKPERSSRKKKRRRTRSSSGSRSRSRDINRSRDGRNKRRKSRSSSSSPDKNSKRSQRDKDRSRSRSPKRTKRSKSRSQRKQKKKRH